MLQSIAPCFPRFSQLWQNYLAEKSFLHLELRLNQPDYYTGLLILRQICLIHHIWPVYFRIFNDQLKVFGSAADCLPQTEKKLFLAQRLVLFFFNFYGNMLSAGWVSSFSNLALTKRGTESLNTTKPASLAFQSFATAFIYGKMAQ